MSHKRFDSGRAALDAWGASNDTRSKIIKAAEPFHRFLSHVSTRSVLRPRACKFRVSAGGYVPEQPEGGLSFCYLNAAYKIPCDTGIQKFVLVTLANHSDERGVCWPSLSTLARECCIDRVTAIRHLGALEAQGRIAVERQHERVNIYRLTFEPIGGGMVHLPSGATQPASGTVRHEPSTNRSDESSKEGGDKPQCSEPVKGRSKPRLFARDIKEAFNAKRETIKDDDASYKMARYRAGEEIRMMRDGLKPEAKAVLTQLDREERQHLAALID